MKKFLVLFLLLFVLPCYAVENIEYNNLKPKAKIGYFNNIWTAKVNKTDDYFVKKISDGISGYTEFYSKGDEFLFSTATQYEFIYKGSLIAYSNNDLKFYEYYFDDNLLNRRELTYAEVSEMFPDYHIVKISDFTTSTNSYVLKTDRKTLKLILLNDTDLYFDKYDFSTINAKCCVYDLKGFLKIKKKGMLHFATTSDKSGKTPWYVLIVR